MKREAIRAVVLMVIVGCGGAVDAGPVREEPVECRWDDRSTWEEPAPGSRPVPGCGAENHDVCEALYNDPCIFGAARFGDQCAIPPLCWSGEGKNCKFHH